MTWPLKIISCGAVTPVGLNAKQTCAAIRAGISGFSDAFPLSPTDEPVVCANVPARQTLKRSATEWLLNLATRAISECLNYNDDFKRIVLILVLPENHRNHPSLTSCGTDKFLNLLETRLGVRFSPESMVLQDGGAGVFQGIKHATKLLANEIVSSCIIGGVDSMINEVDINRLIESHRLSGVENAQGVVPGEGAAFVRVTNNTNTSAYLANIFGVGFGIESDNVLGNRYSQGRGLEEALLQASDISSIREASISFRVSDMNGERYQAWESLISECRFYRSRRENFPCWYTAAFVGNIGVAASSLLLIIAAVGMYKGYAPGTRAMCEASSDEGLRGACIVGV